MRKEAKLIAIAVALLVLLGCSSKSSDGPAAKAECSTTPNDYGHLEQNCAVVTVTFKDGSTCLATDGAGIVCHWISKGTETVVLPPAKAREVE